MRIKVYALVFLMAVAAGGPAGAQNSQATASLYEQHCAVCHGTDRLGRMGPALLPQNLQRLKVSQAAEVIAQGRGASQMPGFSAVLTPTQIEALVGYIYTPLASVPVWGLAQIRQSRIVTALLEPVDRPRYKADPLNLFVVVELGDHHATLLDGDTFETLHRFPTRFSLHGGPKFSPDGRYVYFASRDGWISKYDLYALEYVAEVRAGINTRNLAISSDGRYVMAANYLPHTLVLLDATDLKPIMLFDVQDDHGNSSRVSAVYTAPPRQSFIVALKDIAEVWEIGYADVREPVYAGLVHDWREQEGLPETGPFPVRRIHLDDYLDDFFFDPSYRYLIGASRNAQKGQVVNLDVGAKIASLDLHGMPHLGSGITWSYKGHPVLATPNLKDAEVSVIDMTNWKTVARIKTQGPGFFMRSHEKSNYAWVDVFFGKHKDVVHVIDKRSLRIVKTLRPAPGKTAAHVEFTRDGRYALLSVWDPQGAVIVYDAQTFKEIKRIPMNKPSGKYNVYNKIHFSSGTSH